MTARRPAGFRAIQVREDRPVSAWLAKLDPDRKQDRALRKSYRHALDQTSENFLHGEVVPIPNDRRFEGIANLRCEDLAGSHRLLYTNIRVEEGTIALVIVVVTHREYDRLFGVRKK